jgi:hypothetical protein
MIVRDDSKSFDYFVKKLFCVKSAKKIAKTFFWFQVSFCCATKRKQDFLLLQRKILSMSLGRIFSCRNH